MTLMKNLEGDLLDNGFEKRENFYNGKLVSITYSRLLQDSVINIFRKIESVREKYRN